MEGREGIAHRFPSTTAWEYQGGGNDEITEKQRCPYPTCGKTFKDLNAHMFTHQSERPEKCPIPTCEYHFKGFARKYDRNRHTLVHYKGTMVCDFCPGSGSAAEKSFSRIDIFKRHLTDVHGVDQTLPNYRKKALIVGNGVADHPSVAGKCSICCRSFAKPEIFYQHLDDCVLRIVQQEDPSEAINARLLTEVENNEEVLKSLQRNDLMARTQKTGSGGEDDHDEGMDDGKSISKTVSSSNSMSQTFAYSRGSTPLRTQGKGRKSKTKVPSSWGYKKELMTLKKRVLCVFDGPHRLGKDQMVLSTEQEVRIKLSDGQSYITDLDIFTVARAEGFHSVVDKDTVLCVSDDPTGSQHLLTAGADNGGQLGAEDTRYFDAQAMVSAASPSSPSPTTT